MTNTNEDDSESGDSVNQENSSPSEESPEINATTTRTNSNEVTSSATSSEQLRLVDDIKRDKKEATSGYEKDETSATPNTMMMAAPSSSNGIKSNLRQKRAPPSSDNINLLIDGRATKTTQGGAGDTFETRASQTLSSSSAISDHQGKFASTKTTMNATIGMVLV